MTFWAQFLPTGMHEEPFKNTLINSIMDNYGASMINFGNLISSALRDSKNIVGKHELRVDIMLHPFR